MFGDYLQHKTINNWRRAEKHFRKALSLAPDDWECNFHLTKANFYNYAHVGQIGKQSLEEVAQVFENCLALQPEKATEYISSICNNVVTVFLPFLSL